MSHFLKSATKFVLVLYSIVLSIGVLYMIVMNPTDHDILIALMALFSNVVVAVVTFYFRSKEIPNEQMTTQEQTSVQE